MLETKLILNYNARPGPVFRVECAKDSNSTKNKFLEKMSCYFSIYSISDIVIRREQNYRCQDDDIGYLLLNSLTEHQFMAKRAHFQIRMIEH